MNTIGTCSLCKGPVVMPMHSTQPTPYCMRCGARAINPHGPVVPMRKPTIGEKLEDESY